MAGLLMLTTFATGSMGNGLVAELGPVVAVAVCYLGFARIERSIAIACVAAGILALALVLAAVHPAPAAELAMFGTGALMLVSGLLLRLRVVTP